MHTVKIKAIICEKKSKLVFATKIYMRHILSFINTIYWTIEKSDEKI